MTNQEAIKRIKEHIAIHKYKESHAIHIVEALEMAISALQVQEVKHSTVSSSTHKVLDTIDRQAAIDIIRKDKIDSNILKIMDALGNGNEALTVNMTCDRHIQLLKNLPSAQSEPEHTMEEFMYGQDLGSPEDGSL